MRYTEGGFIMPFQCQIRKNLNILFSIRHDLSILRIARLQMRNQHFWGPKILNDVMLHTKTRRVEE